MTDQKQLVSDCADLLGKIWSYGNACAELRSPSPELTFPTGYWEQLKKDLADEIVDRVERLASEAIKKRR